MRGLLDTSTFLWWNTEPEKLSARAYELVQDVENDLYFSAVSAWEIAIKHAKGRLDLPEEAESFVISRIRRRGFEPLAIEISHALHAGHLPSHHNDPFDRLLVSQAQLDGLAILTSDANIARYDVEVIW